MTLIKKRIDLLFNGVSYLFLRVQNKRRCEKKIRNKFRIII